jgi:hypothetical protein
MVRFMEEPSKFAGSPARHAKGVTARENPSWGAPKHSRGGPNFTVRQDCGRLLIRPGNDIFYAKNLTPSI